MNRPDDQQPPTTDGWPPPPAPAGGYPPPAQPSTTEPPHGGQAPYAGQAPQAAASPAWSAAPPPAPPVGDGLVTALRVLLVLHPVGFAAIVALQFAFLAELESGGFDLEPLEIALGLVVILWGLGVVIPAVTVWCVWQSKTRRRLESLRPGAPFRQGSGWAVGSWFVPVANLWVPAQAVADLWRNSAPPGAPGPDPTSPLVKRWWTALVIVPVAVLALSFVAGLAMGASGVPVDDPALQRLDVLAGVPQLLALVAAAVFAWQLVGAIHDRVRQLGDAPDR